MSIMSMDKLNFSIFLIVFISLINYSIQNPSLCISQENCADCLDADESCVWCTDNDYFADGKPRCMIKMQMEKSDCKRDKILYNRVKEIETLKNDPLHDYDKGSMDAVQISPQKLKINLRKSRPKSFKMRFKPAQNYPLDLYYLMDLTWSMKTHQERLVGMGEQLGSSLLNLTSNYRVAFGSFADKPIMPYIFPEHAENPCAPEKTTCEPTYVFRHRLNFTSNTKEFIEGVQKSNVTANADNLEGVLEALMQVLVCSVQMDWNDNARKIVVVATDGSLHFAGDGKLSGMVKPNDKKCHLDNKGQYLGALISDYPSVAEIYSELLKHKVNVIFAVIDEIYQYDQLHFLTQDVTSVGRLEMDSSNILELVENGYNKFFQRTYFKDNAPDYIKLNYATNCGMPNEEIKDTNKCDNIEIGKEYEFTINLELLRYPPKTEKSVTIRIEETSLNEGLDIEIEFDVGCECDDVPIENHTLCNQHGSLSCGECTCDKDWLGIQCICNSVFDGEQLSNQCRENTEGSMCSDHGECFCGQCYCHSGYSGKFCSCENCPYVNNVECGGPEHGFCNCDGTCSCTEGWTGEFCDCSTDNSTCQAPNSNSSCSDRGACSCGGCLCSKGYGGEFCEVSSDGDNMLCQFFDPCVQCVTKRRLGMECDEFDKHCFKNSFEHISEFFSSLPENNISCITRFRYEKENALCEFKFSYDYNNDKPSRIYIKNAACPPVKYAQYSIMGIILFTFLLGLLILVIYKIKITVEDKREWVKFEEQKKSELQMESPIYISPVTNYVVPENREFSLNDN